MIRTSTRYIAHGSTSPLHARRYLLGERPLNSLEMRATLLACIAFLAATHVASAAAADDVKIEVSHDRCGGDGATDDNYIVYATNSNSTQTIDVNVKYDSIAPRRHFILFDANLNPVTDRFPKVLTQRLRPRESAKIGCSYTYRAAPTPPTPLRVPLSFTVQTAAYVDANAAEPPPGDARSFTAFILQGLDDECGPGAKPPGMLYLVNLHPYAKLSVSLNLSDSRGSGSEAQVVNLLPLSSERIACSNGHLKPDPIAGATLEADSPVVARLPANPIPEPAPSAPNVPVEHTVVRSKIADELFSVFVDLRSSANFEASDAPFEDPRFYSRLWLEDAIKSALHAAKEHDRPGLNSVQETLLMKLSSSMSVESVYSYELVEPSTLRVRVTDACGRPAINTTQFVFEDETWRIARTTHDSSKTGTAWFKEGMKPTKQFAAPQGKDPCR
jgi:hypothetical protein